MKKVLVLALTVICSLGFAMAASAHPGYHHQAPPPHHHDHYSGDQLKAQRVLDVTRDAIFNAERVAHHYQREELNEAIFLQKRARRNYRQGYFRETIRYSLQAREIAYEIIEESRWERPRHRPHHEPRHGESSMRVHVNL